jgi:hypothetical protein
MLIAAIIGAPLVVATLVSIIAVIERTQFARQ